MSSQVAASQTVQESLKALEQACSTLGLEERRALISDIIFRVLQLPAAPEAAPAVTEPAAENDGTRYTTGVAGMYNGTKDGEAAYIDYATGKTNINPPAAVAVKVADIRTMPVPPSFHGNGFQLVKHTTSLAPESFFAGSTPEGKPFIHENYFPEVKALVEQVTGSKKVFPYLFRLRHQYEQPTDFVNSRKSTQSALPLAHTDRDMTTGPNGIRDVFGEEEGNRLMAKYKRFAQVNVWRGIGQTVNRWPLLFIDTDEIPGGFDYEKNLAKIASSNDPRVALRGVKAHDVVLMDNPHYKYRYASKQEIDEAWVFSSFDSDRFAVAPHGGFWDNSTTDADPARDSIEVRTWTFWDPVDGVDE
jgi:hypothetical protein